MNLNQAEQEIWELRESVRELVDRVENLELELQRRDNDTETMNETIRRIDMRVDEIIG